jgi:RNA polymerase sigma factor (sigma-70 family)
MQKYHQGGNLLPEEHSTPSSPIQRPPTLPVNMDDTELGELFASCMPQLQRAARRLLRNPQDSEDALQDGLLLAFRNLKQFQGRSAFSTWLHSIVRNSARTYVRRMKCRPQCSSEADLLNAGEVTLDELYLYPGPSPEQECARWERSRILYEAVQKLPPRYRSVVHLCDLDGVDPKDAARKLGITASAVKVSLFRARRLAARRIRARYCPPDVNLSENGNSIPGRNHDFSFSRTAGSSGDSQPPSKERYSMHARADKKLDHVGGNRETRRKSSRFWKCSLATSVHIGLHNALRPPR